MVCDKVPDVKSFGWEVLVSFSISLDFEVRSRSDSGLESDSELLLVCMSDRVLPASREVLCLSLTWVVTLGVWNLTCSSHWKKTGEEAEGSFRRLLGGCQQTERDIRGMSECLEDAHCTDCACLWLFCMVTKLECS